jgi:hypothetical protein
MDKWTAGPCRFAGRALSGTTKVVQARTKTSVHQVHDVHDVHPTNPGLLGDGPNLPMLCGTFTALGAVAPFPALCAVFPRVRGKMDTMDTMDMMDTVDGWWGRSRGAYWTLISTGLTSSFLGTVRWRRPAS